MEVSTTGAQAPTLETPPPVINTEPSTIIHGLDRLVVPGAAIGALDDDAAGGTTPSDQSVEQPEGQAQTTEVPVNERINQDPELKAYIEREIQSAASRAVTGAQKKWETETLQRKLQADRQQREEALKELALKAQQGDNEALMELGKTVQAQVLKQHTAQEFLQAWLAEANQTVQLVAGNDQELANQLNIGNFTSVPAWVDAIVATKTQAAVEAERANFQKEIDKLSEAKAADLISARRQNLPTPDVTQPVGGGGTVRQWTSLAEAAALFSQDKIPATEWARARQWYTEGRIPPGVYTGDN